MVSLDSIQALVAPQCAWLQEEILPPAIVFWDRLGVPEWDIYSDAFQECATDAIQAMNQVLGRIPLAIEEGEQKVKPQVSYFCALNEA